MVLSLVLCSGWIVVQVTDNGQRPPCSTIRYWHCTWKRNTLCNWLTSYFEYHIHWRHYWANQSVCNVNKPELVQNNYVYVMYSYSYAPNEPCQLLHSFHCLDSKSSCRALKFSRKGNSEQFVHTLMCTKHRMYSFCLGLFCGTADKEVTINDVETGKLVRCISSAHRYERIMYICSVIVVNHFLIFV